MRRKTLLLLKGFLFLFVLFCLTGSTALAEESENLPESVSVSKDGSLEENLNGIQKITLQLPDSLAGFTLQIKTEEGEVADTTKVDAQGKAVIRLSDQTSNWTVVANTTKPVSLGYASSKMSFSFSQVICLAVGASLLSVLLARIVIRRQILRQLHGIRELIYEEDLD